MNKKGIGSNQYVNQPPTVSVTPPPTTTQTVNAAATAAAAPFLSARTTNGDIIMPMQASDLTPGDRIDGRTVTAVWEVDPDVDDPHDDPGYTAAEFTDGTVETFRPTECLQVVPADDDCFDENGWPN